MADSGSDAHVCNADFAPRVDVSHQEGQPRLFDVQQNALADKGVKKGVPMVIGDESGMAPCIADFQVSNVAGPVLSLGLLARKGLKPYPPMWIYLLNIFKVSTDLREFCDLDCPEIFPAFQSAVLSR